jgi:8-hydroxy-5-deazaflavin:NADPH oxidoreductase
MKIGILGAGTVASTLAEALSSKGHTICVGCRNPHSPKALKLVEKNPEVVLESLENAINFGSIVVLAINPWTEIEKIISSVPAESFTNKVVMDVSNNINFTHTPALAFTDRSMGEYIQDLVPLGYVVKTLNCLPAEMMVNPVSKGLLPAIMWTAGKNKEAKQKVQDILHDLGWQQVVDLGDIELSKLQESFGLMTSIIITNLLSASGSK